MADRGGSKSPGKPVTSSSNLNQVQHADAQQDAPAANLPPPVDDLHRLFPDIPSNERAIRNFPCSHLVRKFMCVGRLYLTPTRLCFVGLLSANVSFEWRNITLLEKKSSLLFDSIEMKVRNNNNISNNNTNVKKEELQEVTFTGFVNGSDEPYQIMKTLWNVKKNFAGNNSSNINSGAFSQVNSAENSNLMNRPQTTGMNSSSTDTPTFLVAPEQSNNNNNMNNSSNNNNMKRGSTGVTPRNGDDEPNPQNNGNVPLSPNPKQSSSNNNSFDIPTSTAEPMNPSKSNSEIVGDNGSSEALTEKHGTSIFDENGGDEPATQPAQVNSQNNNGAPRYVSPTKTNNQNDANREQQGSPAKSHQRTSSNVGAGVLAAPPLTTTSTDANKISPSLTGGDGLTLVTPEVQLDPSHQAAVNNRSFDGSPISPQTLAAATTTTKFPGVPKTERVLDSFQCSYIQGVHRYGRLAITQNYLLFSSMVCSPFSIKLSEVETVTKQTNLVILEGFAVVMKDGVNKHEFTSFAGTRDKAFGLICDLIRSQAQVNAALGIGSKPSQTTLELGTKKEEPTTTSAPLAPKDGASNKTKTARTKDQSDDDEESSSEDGDGNDDADDKGNNNNNNADNNNNDNVAEIKSFATKRVSADPSTWYDQFDQMESFDKIVGHSYGDTIFSPPSKLMEVTLLADMDCIRGATMSDVFRSVFDDNVPFAFEYRRLRTPIPDTDTVVEPWQPPTATTAKGVARPSELSAGIRIMTCRTTIKALTSVICPYTEYQRFLLCKKNGAPTLLIQLSGQAAGAMFSESFRAETLMVFQPHPLSTPDAPQVRCHIYFHINYISTPFMIKGKVKSAATAECIDSYKNFFDVANRFLTADLASSPKTPGSPSTGTKKGKKKGAQQTTQPQLPIAQQQQPAMLPSVQVVHAPPPANAKPPLPPMVENVRKVFFVLALWYAFRSQFSLWWSQPEDPSVQANYIAYNHLITALSNMIIAYVLGEIGDMIPL